MGLAVLGACKAGLSRIRVSWSCHWLFRHIRAILSLYTDLLTYHVLAWNYVKFLFVKSTPKLSLTSADLGPTVQQGRPKLANHRQFTLYMAMGILFLVTVACSAADLLERPTATPPAPTRPLAPTFTATPATECDTRYGKCVLRDRMGTGTSTTADAHRNNAFLVNAAIEVELGALLLEDTAGQASDRRDSRVRRVPISKPSLAVLTKGIREHQPAASF